MGKSKHLALCALGVAAVVATPAFAGVASVVDGSFESDPLGQITTETPTSTGWYMGSGPEAYGYTFIMNNANNSGDTINLSTLAPTTEGSQFLGSDPTYYPDSVNQDITGLTVGQTYVVSFEWAGGQQAGFTGTTTDFWAVSLGGGVPQDTATITVPSGGFSGWFDVTMDFTATAVNETLSFLPGGSGNPPFVLLDSVSLTAVPEPSTWAMMLLGFGGLGVVARLRRRRAAAAA